MTNTSVTSHNVTHETIKADLNRIPPNEWQYHRCDGNERSRKRFFLISATVFDDAAHQKGRHYCFKVEMDLLTGQAVTNSKVPSLTISKRPLTGENHILKEFHGSEVQEYLRLLQSRAAKEEHGFEGMSLEIGGRKKSGNSGIPAAFSSKAPPHD